MIPKGLARVPAVQILRPRHNLGYASRWQAIGLKDAGFRTPLHRRFPLLAPPLGNVPAEISAVPAREAMFLEEFANCGLGDDVPLGNLLHGFATAKPFDDVRDGLRVDFLIHTPPSK